MELITVVKGNRQITVTEREAASYLKRGYNQVDAKGNVVKYATAGGTVSLQEHNTVLQELNDLKANGGANNAAEVEALKKELADVREELAAMEEDNERLSGELKKAKNQK